MDESDSGNAQVVWLSAQACLRTGSTWDDHGSLV